jgi:hypothetical protein
VRRGAKNLLERILSIGQILIPVAVVGVFIYFAVTIIQSSIADMQFQQTHPITQAKILSIFTHTYSDYDSQTNTSTTRTEDCAARIRFRANGQDIEVDVSKMQACPMQVGDQPKIAYDPRQPTQLQFVPGGDPLWGNLLQILLALAFAGFALTVGIGFIRFPGKHGFRTAMVFWTIGTLCIIALIVMNVINRNP